MLSTKNDLTDDMSMDKYTRFCKELSNKLDLLKYKNNVYTLNLRDIKKDIDLLRGIMVFFIR